MILTPVFGGPSQVFFVLKISLKGMFVLFLCFCVLLPVCGLRQLKLIAN